MTVLRPALNWGNPCWQGSTTHLRRYVLLEKSHVTTMSYGQSEQTSVSCGIEFYERRRKECFGGRIFERSKPSYLEMNS